MQLLYFYQVCLFSRNFWWKLNKILIQRLLKKLNHRSLNIYLVAKQSFFLSRRKIRHKKIAFAYSVFWEFFFCWYAIAWIINFTLKLFDKNEKLEMVKILVSEVSLQCSVAQPLSLSQHIDRKKGCKTLLSTFSQNILWVKTSLVWVKTVKIYKFDKIEAMILKFHQTSFYAPFPLQKHSRNTAIFIVKQNKKI